MLIKIVAVFMSRLMYCYFWTLLGVALFLISPSSSQQLSPLCVSKTGRFHMENPQLIPSFCTQLQLRFNSATYRINFTESEVDSVCNSDICRAVMTDLTLPCITFVSTNHCHVCDCACMLKCMHNITLINADGPAENLN